MVKLILAQVKQYKKASLLTPVFTAAEVVMEVLILLSRHWSLTGASRREICPRFCCTGVSCW